MSATPDTDSNPAASNTGILRRTRPDSSGTGTGTGTDGGSASASGGGGDAPLQDLDTGRRSSSLRRKEFPWKEFLARSSAWQSCQRTPKSWIKWTTGTPERTMIAV